MTTYSIYHFFAKLIDSRSELLASAPLEEIPVLNEQNFFSCINPAQYPDRVIRVNADRSRYSGGELIELKDARSYSVSSFNSTIPTGRKRLDTFLTPRILAQMEAAGDPLEALPVREAYYVVRGRSREHTKVCITHGSFFETIPVEALIRGAFAQVIDERLGTSLDEETKSKIIELFTDQSDFSQSRSVENASVRLRFRVMTEVRPEGNILNSGLYPEIGDDTLNLIVPLHEPDEAEVLVKLAQEALAERFTQVRTVRIKHPFNGWFIVFQCPLESARHHDS
ncbi:MAG: hypothetical protein L6Q98_18345 [Anaerolineae bacterium]|nr:hypothetical protein [Anaerolineae bacterium]NUQ06880.1 hypothetical protein [Anaerolineae bacterium]